ncbi:MAG TPA: PilZ domain-containing protein [Geobacteraceae bacterium]|nr:PilZ domain-containing protein [Geobacteraceae bacterium]
MEQRHFSRVVYHMHAVITCNGDSFSADVENLSLHGMLVRSERVLSCGKQVEITISLVDAVPPVEIHLNGVVVRSQEGELGFRFERIELDSFVHLRNIVSIAKGDADRVMDEFIDFVGANVHAADDRKKG